VDAEIRFLYCGNGDTILIRGGDEWALIDANLTHRSGARKRLAEELRKNHVTRLRFVCITHFDQDHIRGLGSFLREHFGPNGRERHQWEIEQIIVPVRHDVRWEFFETHRALFERWRTAGLRVADPLEEIFFTLFEIYDVDDATFHCYSPGTRLVARDRGLASVALGPWEVTFLGPSDVVEARYAHAFRHKWGLSAWPRSQWPRKLRLAIGNNETSRILALRNRVSGDTVLLTGDALATSIDVALRQWENLHCESGSMLDRTFRVVKASHHGAWTARSEDNCHLPRLYQQACAAGYSQVVISCNDYDENHPHPEVLLCANAARIECRSTGAPLPPSARGSRRGIGAPLGSPRLTGSLEHKDVVVRHDHQGFSINGGFVHRVEG
jgi:hypothetical protein